MPLSGYRARIRAQRLDQLNVPTITEAAANAQASRQEGIMSSMYGGGPTQQPLSSSYGGGGGGGEGGGYTSLIWSPSVGQQGPLAPGTTIPNPLLPVAPGTTIQNPGLDLGSYYSGGGNAGAGGIGSTYNPPIPHIHSTTMGPPAPPVTPPGLSLVGPGQGPAVVPAADNSWTDPKTGKRYSNLSAPDASGQYTAVDDQGRQVWIDTDGTVVTVGFEPTQIFPVSQTHPYPAQLSQSGGGGGGGGGFGSMYGGGRGGGRGRGGESLRDYLAGLNLINWNIGG